MELTKLKCKCGHHYKIHASLEGCLACEGHYCGEGQVSILENAHAALETANADLLEVLEELLDSTVYADAEGLIDIDRGGCDDSDHREIVERCKQAIRRHKGE